MAGGIKMALIVIQGGAAADIRGNKLQSVLLKTFKVAVKACRAFCSTKTRAVVKHRYLEGHQEALPAEFNPVKPWEVVNEKTGAVVARITPTFWQVRRGCVYSYDKYGMPEGTWEGVRFTLTTEVIEK